MQLDFDPTKISYEALVEAFFDLHDATRSSPSRQYMSVIFVADAEQERVAHAVKERVRSRTRGALKTKILPAGRFYVAEDYHQKYALQSNARFFREFEAMYPDFWELVDSPAATRVNAYLYGFGGAEATGHGARRSGPVEKVAGLAKVARWWPAPSGSPRGGSAWVRTPGLPDPSRLGLDPSL